MDVLPAKELMKIMLKFLRDVDTKLEDYQNRIITEIQQIKTKLDAQENKIESLINRINAAEERISETEDTQNESAQRIKQLETNLSKTNKMMQEMKDYLRKLNIRIIGLPEGVERESGMQAVLDEIIQENFQNTWNTNPPRIQDGQRTPNRHDPKRSSPRHTVLKFYSNEDKEGILRQVRSREKITYRGKPIRITADFSEETLQARREWTKIFQVLKQNNCQPKIIYPAKISFVYENEIRYFNSKEKLEEYVYTKPALQSLLRNALVPDKKEANHKQSWQIRRSPN